MTETTQLDLAFAALANPTRRAILSRLAQGEATVNALAGPFDISLPAISKHIRVLENAGLITRARDAQFRPCALNAAPLKAVAFWTDQYRSIWEARFDVMQAIMKTLKENDMVDQTKWVKIQREFEAPIDVVWQMWTDPALFKKWYGPMGMSVPTAEMNLVVGGTRKICMEMKSPQRTMSMWFTGVYKEIKRPSRLVYTESMCDAQGVIISPQSMGMPEGHPDITEVIVELSEAGGKTMMTMVHVGVPEGSAGAGGWKLAFDKLSETLKHKV